MTDAPLAAGGFVPINPNPYIVGNPVRGRAMFFGREAEFELVRKRFLHSSRGGLLVFCGERRSGKTSILFQILDGRLGPDFIPVLIDMQSMAVGNEVEFLTRVSEEVLAALGPGAEGITLPDFSRGANHSSTFQRFVRSVLENRPNKSLIMLFDEYELFENKIDAGLLSPDVLHVLANLLENYPVFLVFTGSQHLEQRRQEYWKILGKSLHKMISFLERDDALNLIHKPVEGRVHYSDQTVEAIWRLTAGQPFYTQAICQSLVDLLNEGRSNDATRQRLSDVVDGIVNNPLPQMIFMWDALERDEKLVLALLAESLADESKHAEVDDLTRLLRKRQYPLDLDRARAATTLEKLFKSDMLLRSDKGKAHAYAFRMDLWRLWIQRQHSVWQVMREEGLEIRRPIGSRLRKVALIVIGLAVVLIAPSLVLSLRGRGPRDREQNPTAEASLAFFIEVDPRSTAIHFNGEQLGVGVFRGEIATGKNQRILLTAPGYADSEFVLNLRPDDSGKRFVALRELFGDLRIETRPSGAALRVDGRVVGKSPLKVPGLSAAKSHRVEATLAGHGQAQRELTIEPNQLTSSTLVLTAETADLLVMSEPPGCEILMDGSASGKSPLTLSGLALGRHTFSASREGYLVAETTLTVGPQTGRVHLALVPEPPGFLVVRGDLPAVIWIDDVLVVENVQNSGPRRLSSGTHRVRVVLTDGKSIDQAVAVKSRERTTYDYTTGAVARRPEVEP